MLCDHRKSAKCHCNEQLILFKNSMASNPEFSFRENLLPLMENSPESRLTILRFLTTMDSWKEVLTHNLLLDLPNGSEGLAWSLLFFSCYFLLMNKLLGFFKMTRVRMLSSDHLSKVYLVTRFLSQNSQNSCAVWSVSVGYGSSYTSRLPMVVEI